MKNERLLKIFFFEDIYKRIKIILDVVERWWLYNFRSHSSIRYPIDTVSTSPTERINTVKCPERMNTVCVYCRNSLTCTKRYQFVRSCTSKYIVYKYQGSNVQLLGTLEIIITFIIGNHLSISIFTLDYWVHVFSHLNWIETINDIFINVWNRNRKQKKKGFIFHFQLGREVQKFS